MLFRNLELLRSDPLAFVGLMLAVALALLVAITVHEFSHALVAGVLGDDTPRRQGRLSLNPLVHLDALGTILLFVIGFGWGKPVPVNPLSLRGGPRGGMAKVALAGPVSNLVVAGVFALPLRLGAGLAAQLLELVVFYNIVLAIFNLIPIPPLDGFRVAMGLVPRNLAYSLSRLEVYGPMLLMLVVAFDSLAGVGLLGRALYPAINLFGQLFLGFPFQ